MISRKKVEIVVYKPLGYKPIPKEEEKSITKRLRKEILELANRFDGVSNLVIKITIEGKGNA